MIDELTTLLPDFPGQSNLTRCFAHIVNLVAKTAIRVFDVPRATNADLDEAEKLLQNLAEDLDLEQMEAREGLPPLNAAVLNEDEFFTFIANSTEGWVDERQALGAEERAALDASVLPVRMVLVKVSASISHAQPWSHWSHIPQLRKFTFTVIHSSTILLPKWIHLLKGLCLAERNMPRDVTTRWNSTYDMLVFAYEYRNAIDAFTGDKTLKLRQYELSDLEWKTVKDLIEVLKVRLMKDPYSEIY